MTRFSDKTYWLIGASEGLGRETAKQLHAAGANLVLSARNVDRLNELANRLPKTRTIPIDVTDCISVKKAVLQIGSIDGIIYNAGAYDPMSAQNWNTDAALKMVDVNLSGAIRILGEILPRFLAQKKGDITLIGSLSGYRGLPGAVGYGCSKAALISLAETMRYDLRGSGVTVRIVNPGFIKTRLTDKNSFKMPMLMEPADAAKRVLHAMRHRRFRTDFPAPFSWSIRALDLLPDFAVYRGR